MKSLLTLLLIVTLAMSDEVITEDHPTPATPLYTPNPFQPSLDTQTELIAIPERGMLLQRQGTVLSHPNLDIMTAVVSFERLPFMGKPITYDVCSFEILPILENINKTIEMFKQRTHAVFQATHIFTTEDICYILEGDVSKCRVSRKKRFAMGAVAMGVASASMAVAVSGLSLATANRVDLDNLENYVNQNSDQIQQLETKLQLVSDKQQIILDTQRSLLGYVQNITEAISTINEALDCLHDVLYMLRLESELTRRLKDILQFIDLKFDCIK